MSPSELDDHPLSTWPNEALEDALRDASHTLYLLGALDQRKLDFDPEVQRLRQLSIEDRGAMRAQLTSRVSALRGAIILQSVG